MARVAALAVAAASTVGLVALVPALGVVPVLLLAILSPVVPLTAMVVAEAVLRRVLPPARHERAKRVLATRHAA